VPTLHVGLNLLYLVPGQVGGTEIYARRLIDALAQSRPGDRFTIFCGRECAPTFAERPANVALRELPVRCAVKPARIAAELTLLPRAASRAGVDLLHSLGTTTPLHGGGVRVVTVHDLIYEHFPGAFPAAARYGLKAIVGPGARRAARVQADSHAAAGEISELLRVPPERIDVVHLGLGMRRAQQATPESELRGRWSLGAGPVVLSVAAALPHKNLDRLLRAFAALGREDARLVLVGHGGRVTEELEALARQLGVAARVRFTGWVSDADVEGAYALAAAFLYPSLHEGFGMPVLEAMARGVPVACADATSLPEVAGDAALLFDPTSVEAIAAAIARLLDEPGYAAQLAQAGPPRAAGFTWEACAQACWESYERALAPASTGQ
jgi:glycosyltransferase involved in cell wall biosynthesis